MAQYQRVHVRFWRDPEVKGWSDEATLLAIYLLTCEHRTSEGLFYLPLAFAAEELGPDWTTEDVRHVLDELEGFADYDRTAQVVLLNRAMKYEAPKGEKQIKGAITRLRELPDTGLWDGFIDAAARYAPDLHGRLADEGLIHSPNPTEGVSKGYPDPQGTPPKGGGESSHALTHPHTPPRTPGTDPEPSPEREERDDPRPLGGEDEDRPQVEEQTNRTLALIATRLPNDTPALRNGTKLRRLVAVRIQGGWRPQELTDEACEGSWDRVDEPWGAVIAAIEGLSEHRRPPDIRDTYPNGDRPGEPRG